MVSARWITAVLAGGAFLLAGCGASVGPGQWELGMITPDERGMIVWFGTASGLDSFTVAEDTDAVTIDVEVESGGWGPRNGAFYADWRFVELEEPLGDRELRGCLRKDCREFLFDVAVGGDVIVVTPDAVVTGYPDTEQHRFDRHTGRLLPTGDPVDVPLWTRVYGTTYPAGEPDLQVRVERLGLYVENRGGHPVWSTSLLPDYDTAPVMVDGLVVVAASGPDERSSRIIAFDVRTADVRWEHQPFVNTLAVTACGLVITRSDVGTELLALDVMTGEERWRTDLRAVMGDVRVTDTELFVSIQNGLVSLEPSTGDIVWWSHLDAGLWTPPG